MAPGRSQLRFVAGLRPYPGSHADYSTPTPHPPPPVSQPLSHLLMHPPTPVIYFISMIIFLHYSLTTWFSSASLLLLYMTIRICTDGYTSIKGSIV